MVNQESSNLPPEFAERLKNIVPKDHLKDIIASFCQPKPITFRVNTIKIGSNELKEKLINLGFQLQEVPWYPDAFIVKHSPEVKLSQTELFNEGYLYVQSLSSMIPVLILDPQEGEVVGDIAAAPGSKTTQIAALMNNTGLIIANDISPQRLYILKQNLSRLEVTNVRVTRIPGQTLYKDFPEQFDRTLVDVPCGMEGRFSCLEKDTFKGWSLSKVKRLSQSQRKLLRSAFSATKPGGLIVYSTCTLSPEENEEVINWLLKKEPRATVEKISLDIEGSIPAITSWNGKEFNPSLKHALRILPSSIMEGFFVAKIRKK
jgi:16S rRNA (cytosine1407-C5)-methyltransferase